MKVPLVSLDAMHQEGRTEILQKIQKVYDGNWFISGSEVEKFERKFAEYVGLKYCIGCKNGEVIKIAHKCSLKIIEDATQAHGAEYFGKKAGVLGDTSGFRFYPTKNLGGLGDGGAVVTDDDELAEKVRVLGNYGAKVKYYNLLKEIILPKVCEGVKPV